MHIKEAHKVIKLLPPKQVLNIAIDALKPRFVGSEDVAVGDSLSRILAEDITSPVDIPVSNKAAMDGYAVRSEDTIQANSEKRVRLKVVGRLFLTDSPRDARIGKGEAYQVATGSTLPIGADAVVRLEWVKVLGESIEVATPIRRWANVELIGEDVQKGKVVLRKGRMITPNDIGLLIALGMRRVAVARKPRVGILSVGGELRDIDSPEPDKVVNNYAYVIAGLVSESGAIPIILGIASDHLEEIVEKIRSHIDKLDMVLTIGGCSVGEKDLVADAVKMLGEPGLLTHGVKVVPLKVSGCGSIDGKPIVMLPGHIVSAVGTFYVFALPLLNVLCGLDPYSRPFIIKAQLEEEIRGKPGIGVFKLLELSVKDEKIFAKPLPWGTNRLSHLIKANGFTIVAAGTDYEKGQMIEAALLRLPDGRETTPPVWLKQ